jgi:predicted nucleic acid-binding protein
MITFALDTNIVSYILQDRDDVTDRLDAETGKGNKVVIPPIVYYEIRRGLLAKGATTKAKLFDELLSDLEVEGISIKTLDIAAEEYARLKITGQPITDADLLIGAYCIEKGYTLVTNNVKHLSIINGLTIVNWADAS